MLVLTTLDTPATILASVRAGARGYVSKSVSPSKLHEAVRTVHRGEPFLPPEVTELLVQAETTRAAVLPELTERELEIVRLVARGVANKEIAARLFVAEVTVRTHLRNIFEKLEVRGRVELTLYALRAGWVSLAEFEKARAVGGVS